MHVEILASGSRGNVTAVWSEQAFLLLDCGKPFHWTLAKLNHKLPDAVLVTHEHGDHSKAAKNFLARGVDVYMTAGTIRKLQMEARHNLHTIKKRQKFSVADVSVEVIGSIHDAAEPVNFILQDACDRLLLLTDTGGIPDGIRGDFTKILIEANYSIPALMSAELNYGGKLRILNNHLSIERAEIFLAKYPKAEVSLIHVSPRHGNADEFYVRLGRDNYGAKSGKISGDIQAQNRGAARQERRSVYVGFDEYL